MQTDSKIWDRNYFLQGTSIMEPDLRKINNTGNIKQVLKRDKKNGKVMTAHVECTKRVFNLFVLLTKNCN